jgi:drug/metabolite transporter (DMT)-like permease
MSTRLKAHIALFLANALYGLNYFVVKEVVPSSINPVALTVLRAVGALFFLWVSGFWFKTQKIASTDKWKMMIGGLLGITVSQTLLIVGISHTSSINASIIMTTSPLFVLLISAYFLKIKLSIVKVLGIVLGATGAILVITSNGSISFSNKTFLGDSIILTNAISYGAYLVWTKPIMAKYDSFTVMRWMFFYGAIFMCIFGGYFFVNCNFAAIRPIIWLAIGFIVFGATFLTYLFNIYGLQYVNPTTVSIYIYIQPIIASLLAMIIRNESLSFTRILAMLMVFSGVYFVSIYKTKEKNTISC